MQTSTPSVQLEQVAADGARLRSLFDALVVLLEGDCSARAISTARGIAQEAGALVSAVAEQAEELVRQSAGER